MPKLCLRLAWHGFYSHCTLRSYLIIVVCLGFEYVCQLISDKNGIHWAGNNSVFYLFVYNHNFNTTKNNKLLNTTHDSTERRPSNYTSNFKFLASPVQEQGRGPKIPRPPLVPHVLHPRTKFQVCSFNYGRVHIFSQRRVTDGQRLTVPAVSYTHLTLPTKRIV